MTYEVIKRIPSSIPTRISKHLKSKSDYTLKIKDCELEIKIQSTRTMD